MFTMNAIRKSMIQKIHDTENPITSLIQYEEGDSNEFYNLRKQSMMGGVV